MRQDSPDKQRVHRTGRLFRRRERVGVNACANHFTPRELFACSARQAEPADVKMSVEPASGVGIARIVRRPAAKIGGKNGNPPAVGIRRRK
jgi:hypothetical protein